MGGAGKPAKPKAVAAKAGQAAGGAPVKAKTPAGKANSGKAASTKAGSGKSAKSKASPTKAPATKAAATKAPTTKAPTTKAAVGKASTAKASTTKPAPAKAGSGAAGAKKPAAKSDAKVAPKAAAEQAEVVVAGSEAVKAPAKTKPDSKGAAKAAPTPAAAGEDKPKRKGITIVSKKGDDKKPAKKVAKKSTMMPQPDKPLLGPGVKRPMPLIPSGPRAVRPEALDVDESGKPRKSPFSKKELAKYREILLRKRAELVGDVSMIETEALQGSAAEAGRVASKGGEEGAEDFDRTLSLDLAAVDRRLIREIDDALARIEDNTYGLCETTGRPISAARLEELPWTRYSIEAARALERGGFSA